jgi:hypothetical protein
MILTELGASRCFAHAWTRKNFSELLKIISPMVYYGPSSHSDGLVGQKAVELLNAQMNDAKINNYTTYAQHLLAKILPEYLEIEPNVARSLRDCVLRTIYRLEDDISGLFFFEVESGLIKCIEVCDPIRYTWENKKGILAHKYYDGWGLHPIITELDAATNYARSINRKDPCFFVELLATDASFQSEITNQLILGKDAIAEYFSQIMENQMKMNLVTTADLVKVWEKAEDINLDEEKINYSYGVFITQGDDEQNNRLVQFEIEGKFIKRINVSQPYAHNWAYGLTGKYPI